MKILIVSSYFGKVIGGALNFIKELSIELSSRGHEVNLVLDDRYKKLFSEKKFKIIWFSSKKITSYSPSCSFLKIMSNIDTDVILLQGYMSFQTDFGSLIGYLRKIPVVLTPHGSLRGFDYLNESFRSKIPYHIHDALILKSPTRIAKYVIGTSQIEYNDCKRFGVQEEKIGLIPLPFTLPSKVNIERSENKKSKLLFVGRIVPLKNIDILLKAVKIVKEEIPEIEFSIVGEEIAGRLEGDIGYKQQMISLVKSLGLENDVVFKGWKTGEELYKIYQESDLFVLASTYENFGLPLLEAASFGLPLISTNVGVARELIGNDEGGNIISKTNPEEIAKKIIDILRCEKRYEKASIITQKNSKQFSIKNITDKYEKILMELKQN